ncbi:MAG: hypothetical protein J7527_20620, partial [Chitinophagaceae bacterium]|nr:hypothetical protein [Chitinophagaceae bacterium]
DFEKSAGEWFISGTNTSFEYGVPASTFINRAASGSKAFKTNLSGMHNSNESSLLSSPGFNLSGLKNPRMSISLAQDIDYCYAVEYCESLFLYHNIGGTSWPQLPFSTKGTYHWGTTWGDDRSKRWRVATTWLPALPTVGLRFQFRSDAIIQKEGIAIDNIHIYDSIGPVYGGGLPSVEVKQALAPNNEWTHFIKDGLVIASINTEGQDLGDLTVSNYKHSASPNFHGQYYLRRHFGFHSDKKPSAPVTVRVYYRDEDVDSLFYARNCTGCTGPDFEKSAGEWFISGTNTSF